MLGSIKVKDPSQAITKWPRSGNRDKPIREKVCVPLKELGWKVWIPAWVDSTDQLSHLNPPKMASGQRPPWRIILSRAIYLPITPIIAILNQICSLWRIWKFVKNRPLSIEALNWIWWNPPCLIKWCSRASIALLLIIHRPNPYFPIKWSYSRTLTNKSLWFHW